MVVGAVRWTDELAPAARLPEKLSTLPTRLQPGSEDSIDQVKSLSSVSETVTPKAVPAPLFWIVTVKPIGLPMSTGSTWSASLSMPSSGQSTTIVAVSRLFIVIWMSFDSFVASTVTEFRSAPQSSRSVSPDRSMEISPSGARSPRSGHDRTEPVMVQSRSGSATSTPSKATASRCQATSPGRLSVRLTSYAVPSPMLVMTMENSATSPALMASSSAVLTTWRSGQLTVTSSEAVLSSVADGSFDSLVASTVTVFGTRPQSAASVVATIWTLNDAPAARSSGPQLRTPPSIDQPLASPSMVQSMPAGRVSEAVAP